MPWTRLDSESIASLRLQSHQPTGFDTSFGTFQELCYISFHVDGVDTIPTNYFFPVPFKLIEHLHQPSIQVSGHVTLRNNRCRHCLFFIAMRLQCDKISCFSRTFSYVLFQIASLNLQNEFNHRRLLST